MKISSNDIVNELKELSPLLAGMEKVNVFTIPEGYFDNVSATVLFAVREEANNLPAFSKQSTFNVPVDYFESLAGNILTRIKENEINHKEELRAISPMLYSIQNENVYKLPDGYFNGLATAILKRVQPQQAKVISMRKRSGFLKYAMVASVVGVMAFGIYKIDKNIGVSGASNNSLYASLDPSIQQGKDMGIVQFNASLDSLSTQEIASYLEKHTDEADVAQLTSSLDAGSVPNQDEYIIDDKALDNYLQELNSSSSKN